MNESRRLHSVQTPIIPVIADLIRAHPGTISLGQGVVNYTPPPAAAAQIERFLSQADNHKYQATAGVGFLVERLKSKLARENGLNVSQSDGNCLMVTAGGNQAFLNAILAIADPGDEIILPVPYYFNHEMAIAIANARAVLVPTDANFQIDLDALRAAVTPRTRAIVTVSPNNPSGAVYPETTLRMVNSLCAERGVYHISDEAYEYFTFDDARHFSPGCVSGASAHTISLYSMSKAYGFASWRIGWMVYPLHLESAMRKIQDTVIICPPAIAQYAAFGALEEGRPFVQTQIDELGRTRAMVKRQLESLEEAGFAEVPKAQGALYFLLRVKSRLSPLAYATRLIREHGVAVIPGDAFGLTHGCHLRVAYGALQASTATEGIGRLVEGVKLLSES